MSPFSSPDLCDADPAPPEAPPRAAPGSRGRVVAHALVTDVARVHGDALLRTAKRYSNCADDAHDAYQRAMERLLEHAATIDRTKAVAWMHVVVRREAGVVRRNHGPTTVPFETDDVDEALHRLSPVPDERVHAIDLAQRASEALATLKEAEAQALCLRAQGMSYDEIADLYGWSYSKVNRAVTEGRKAFVDHYTAVEAGVVCGDTAALLSDYVTGTLKPRVAFKVRTHLVRCSGCRALLHAERDADLALRALLPTVFVAAATERSARATGWFHDHLLGPAGHLAGKFQPAADHLVASKLGLVAASTVALAGSGLAVERQMLDAPSAPALSAGVSGGPRTAQAQATAPSMAGPLSAAVDQAVSNGRVGVARLQERERAVVRARVRKQRAIRRARAAAARRRANAREFAGGVSEFDLASEGSGRPSASAASASTASTASGGSRTRDNTSSASSAPAPPEEVPVGGGDGSSSVDVITEGAPASGAFGD